MHWSSIWVSTTDRFTPGAPEDDELELCDDDELALEAEPLALDGEPLEPVMLELDPLEPEPAGLDDADPAVEDPVAESDVALAVGLFVADDELDDCGATAANLTQLASRLFSKSAQIVCH